MQADKAGVGDADKWLKGEEDCVVTLWNGTPIAVQPPNFVELKIVETDPGVRGDTSGGGGKPATLETGAVVRVPLFVGQDEIIKVDTRIRRVRQPREVTDRPRISWRLAVGVSSPASAMLCLHLRACPVHARPRTAMRCA